MKMTDTLLGHMIDRARQEGEKTLAGAPRAERAEYLEDANELLVELASGTSLRIPVEQVQGLRGADADALHDLELTPDGLAIHWDELDAHFTVPGLVRGVYGTKAWMRAIGKKGGTATSGRKRQAARENGKRGGRPSHAPLPHIEPREGRFLLEEKASGQFLVRLVATNGRELLSSPKVESHDEAVAWTRTIKARVQTDELRFDLRSSEGGACLRLYDMEDRLLGTSRRYSAKSTASRAKVIIASTILGATLEADGDNKQSAR